MDVTAGEKYQLRKPDWADTIGQGEPPEGVTVTRTDADGQAHTRQIPFGAVVKASATCDRPGPGIATMDASPPLVDTGVVEELEDQFDPIETS
jgi:hypothetical protein